MAQSFIFKEIFRCALKETLAWALKEEDENIEANPTKFEDAARAGGVDSQKCTLIITEGDSAKALAVSTTIISLSIAYFIAHIFLFFINKSIVVCTFDCTYVLFLLTTCE